MLKVYSAYKKTFFVNRVLLWAAVVLVAVSGTISVLIYTRFELQNASAIDCRDIFDPIPSWITDRIEANKSVYVQVSGETGVPWQAIAAIHYREFNLAVSNPANGQGIYQLYSSGQYFPPGAVDRDGFVTQTRLAANFLQAKAQGTSSTPIVSARKLTTNETDLNLLKSTFFSYNGRASTYADQAVTYGFDRINQPFEGSPYVMNKFDCGRSAMGLITQDGSNTITGTDTRMGAFTMYVRLIGEGYWNSLQVGNIPGCAEATNTRLSCIWKLYNSGTKKFTYTASFDERNMLIASGYLYQNVGFYAINPISPGTGNIPIYHLRDNQNGSLLTADSNEYTVLKSQGWTDKGIGFYADPAGSNSGYPVHRFLIPAGNGHFFTSATNQISTLKAAGYTYEGIAFTSMSTYRQETAPPAGQELVYRFGDMPGNGHFWTRSISERDDMIQAGYRYEGLAWKVNQAPTTTPVYRLYSSPMQKHFFTTDLHEKDILDATSSWNYEGIAWYSNSTKNTKPVFRLYSANDAKHFLTTDAYERSELIRVGTFKDEGVAWYQP